MPRLSHLLPLLTLTFACQRVTFPEPGSGDDGQYPDNPGPAQDDDGDDGMDAMVKLDTYMGGGTETAGEGCHLVDLLFVIDDSLSMQGEQDNLVASFDGFIDGMRDYLVDANDFHVGVVTTDAYANNPSECQELGSLVTRSSVGECGPFAEGHNFMTAEDELDQAFACTAKVGIDGDVWEKPMGAAINAMSPEFNAQGACNEGFIRDDALLVLVIISDEDDDPPGPVGGGSPGKPGDWFDAVVAQKGEEANVVVLALVGTDGIEHPNECPEHNNGEEGAEYAHRILGFVDRFSYGYVGDVCADDYDGFFAQTLTLIHSACEGFDPP
jgi:hypothetical protein